MIPTAITVGGLVGLLVSEHRGSDARLLFKPIASIGFVWLALDSGLPRTAPGWWILVGLVASLAGDVLLLSDKQFLKGLIAFAIGHAAFTVAFVASGTEWGAAAIAAVVASIAFWVVRKWLMPHVDDWLRQPVLAYMAIISLMVVTAAASIRLTRFVGAGLFYLSDLAVARNQFIRSEFANKLVGLPLYYAGQLLLASTVA